MTIRARWGVLSGMLLGESPAELTGAVELTDGQDDLVVGRERWACAVVEDDGWQRLAAGGTYQR